MGNTYGKPIRIEDLVNLKYDETSPTGLRYKNRTHPNQNKELVAGTYVNCSRTRHHCYDISINKTGYRCHRIVWYLMKGEDPIGYEIDHIDGNPWNNHISNLRKVSREINVRNASKRKDNTSGTTGVTFTHNKGTNESTYAMVNWIDCEGKRKTKSFSCSKFGLLEAFAEAVKYRNIMIAERNLKGAGYSNRHGKSKGTT